MNEVVFKTLQDNSGKSEFINFIYSLPDKDRIKLLKTIEKIENNGFPTAIRMEWIKKLDNGIYEIRSKLGTNIQRAIYFQKVNNEYIITHGFTKKTQKTPPREIEHAQRVIEKYKRGDLYEYDI
ncbi:type II toxin-antitoxin system RelE/ParE family toxin [Staphylococcus epidermidis]|nr:type II toxin-antitoxin system RelE/ParE family toxin [Staphylococcus epidermidis]MBM6212259.1 type II toxin-antitoxin system RelE/ParE family toxin [Staphylococcus epidermidis]MBM6219278.1 type II toxin-antitoxin system RelE/ParE family toxin [Staphylococcus epidermidis]MBM6223800.1 type II toxin-antitoxin system RelE/ParE family toxin [Staphylococcus epidermidis]MBM6226168.1 type II toxin-antitoxin system RelE/ParE family toxin [Staphylococcus epidermidis]